ncbi:MAG: Gx transporter family protein [Clostridia bacterium]|nr:Gx transporter family protein [Clostridia bacterium]
MRNNTVKLTTLALSVSFALILSYIESRIPTFVAIPGVKMGLANIAVIFTLYKLGIKEAVAVSFVRVVMVSVLFGSPVSFIYSVSGAIVSLCCMVLLKKITPLSEIAISVVGGVMHNVAQTVVASVILGTSVVQYYLPYLLLSGSLSGVAIGVVSAILIKKINLSRGR